jgi:hypothetical protein
LTTDFRQNLTHHFANHRLFLVIILEAAAASVSAHQRFSGLPFFDQDTSYMAVMMGAASWSMVRM